jgi:hypothetical protein
MKPEERERLAERLLDAHLKRYGQIEPRVGLEARVLANVQDHAQPEHQFWRSQSWARLAAIAAIVVAISVVFWLTRSPFPAGTAPVASTARETSAPGARNLAELAASEATETPLSGVKYPRNPARSAVIAKSDPTPPRLEQFPSPQPLSEQERILAGYVAEFRREAVLVAEAQTRLERQDALETQMLSSDEDAARNSETPK